MKLLAVDTATESCSVAVMEQETPLAEVTTANGRTHSKHLMRMIDTVIGMAGIRVDQLEGFAATVGPGSFTGLRIGISAVKGLAYALRKPVVGISSLDALAWQCNPTPFLICAVIDARKKEVYSCRYRFAHQAMVKKGSEQVASPIDTVRDIHEPCIFVGNGAILYRELISEEMEESALFTDGSQNIIRASTVGRLSLSSINQKPTEDVKSLVPRYIRKSDAQLKIGCG